MRLERIDITGFGRLRDLRIELAPTLTVILGANESGKSTLHRALRAALYGIDSGGQGRAAARSDWARWQPWAGEGYGISLTYALADGRRYRVARRLEQREERVQVQELGGREVTDQLRSGRLVVPGLFHLGVDEAVFAATAYAGDDSLRLDSPDTPTARADSLQEAIERLADSASRATAAEALGRLRQAMERVGTEARSKSPLGAATLRLRAVEAELQSVRDRTAVLAGEQERLHQLEATAAQAEERRLVAQREWLVGRLAALAAQRDERRQAVEEAARLEASIEGWESHAAFPVHLEERVTALGGELHQARATEVEQSARWAEAADQLDGLERRRTEIAASIAVLGRVPEISDEDRAYAAVLRSEVAAESGVERRGATVEAAVARGAALRREVATLGLGGVPLGSVDAVAALVDEAGGAERAARLRPVAGLVVVIGALLAGVSVYAGLGPAALGLTGACLLLAGALLAAERIGGGPASAARRRLARMCPGIDTSAEGLSVIRSRVPTLRRLHTEIGLQQAIVETGRAELEGATQRTADIARRAQVLAARLEAAVGAATGQGAVGAAANLARARAALDGIDAAASAALRRGQLEEEDARLGEGAGALTRLREDAARAARRCTELEEELIHHLEPAGVTMAAGGDPGPAIAAFRQGAAVRRGLEGSLARLGEVRRRITALGAADDNALAAQIGQLGEQLRRRGGDPEAVAGELPLDPGRLHQLELDAERARQDAGSAAASAAALRERLAGALDALPPVADLEDERAACVAVRDHSLQQLEALRRASSLIEEAARRVHRDIAPRLAASVGERLALLTEGRYDEVDVDPERFAVSLRSPERLELVSTELLSRGTREQVALLLRLALVEALGEAGEPVPLLLDDPVLSADPLRRSNVLTFLQRLSETTQVVLTTSDPQVAEELGQSGPCHLVALGRRGVTTGGAGRVVEALTGRSRG